MILGGAVIVAVVLAVIFWPKPQVVVWAIPRGWQCVAVRLARPRVIQKLRLFL